MLISEKFTSMNAEQYLKSRLDDQIEWYDNKSIHAQNVYKRLQSTEIILAACIPFFSGYVTTHWLIPFTIALLGALVVVVTSITRLGNYHENWLQYRSTCELLKHEKYLYLTSTNPYKEKNFQLLVERVESIISSENVNWSQLVTSGNNTNS